MYYNAPFRVFGVINRRITVRSAINRTLFVNFKLFIFKTNNHMELNEAQINILKKMEELNPNFKSTLLENSVIDKAVKNVNTDPSEAQIEAGNYKKGHINHKGFDISIENPKGSTRSGVDEDGKSWTTVIKLHYGYFKNTVGKDKDHVDVFIGNNLNSDIIFVVDQFNNKKEFDEHKVLMGFDDIEQAKKGYLSCYTKDWKGLKDITEVNIDMFKEWLYNGKVKSKPFKEYKLK